MTGGCSSWHRACAVCRSLCDKPHQHSPWYIRLYVMQLARAIQQRHPCCDVLCDGCVMPPPPAPAPAPPAGARDARPALAAAAPHLEVGGGQGGRVPIIPAAVRKLICVMADASQAHLHLSPILNDALLMYILSSPAVCALPCMMACTAPHALRVLCAI